MSQRYKVFYTESIIKSTELIPLPQATATQFRKEVNSLGGATVRIDVPETAPQQPDQNGQITSLVDLQNITGNWVFIQDTSINTFEAAPATPKKNDISIVWWGYVDSYSYEYAKGLSLYRGYLNLRQFGHYLNKSMISYGQLLVRESLNRGFNPEIDGEIVGNLDAFVSASDTPAAIRAALSEIDADDIGIRTSDYAFEPGTNKSENIVKYWTPRLITMEIAKVASNVPVVMDYSGISGYYNDVIDRQAPSTPSFDGESFNTALDTILSPLGWEFVFDSSIEDGEQTGDDSVIKCQVVDRQGKEAQLATNIEITDSPVSRLDIQSVAEKYDGIMLEGDNVLVAASVSTYEQESSNVGVARGWTDDELTAYLDPTNINTNIEELLEGETYKLVTDADLTTYNPPLDKQDVVELIVADVEQKRSKLDTVYQKYIWNVEDDGLITTRAFPGQPSDYGTNTEIPLIPELEFQTFTEGIGDIDLILPSPKIKDTISAQPPICDLRFEKFLPDLSADHAEGQTGSGDNYPYTFTDPTFWYRATGYQKEYGTVYRILPRWKEATKSTASTDMSWKYSVDFKGIEINAPYPESLGSNANDLFADPTSKTNWTNINRQGYSTAEWEGVVGPSQRDPNLIPSTSTGTWLRMIFSFAVYSKQRMQMIVGDPAAEKFKTFREPEFKCWIRRKGFVSEMTDTDDIRGTGHGFSQYDSDHLIQNFPDYETDNVIIRDDSDHMKARVQNLWNYYSRERRAIRIEAAIPTQDELLEVLYPVGTYITNVVDSGKSLPINSYVSSIEYIIESNEPRVIITTEIPAAPDKTRKQSTRRLNSFI